MRISRAEIECSISPADFVSVSRWPMRLLALYSPQLALMKQLRAA